MAAKRLTKEHAQRAQARVATEVQAVKVAQAAREQVRLTRRRTRSVARIGGWKRPFVCLLCPVEDGRSCWAWAGGASGGNSREEARKGACPTCSGAESISFDHPFSFASVSVGVGRSVGHSRGRHNWLLRQPAHACALTRRVFQVQRAKVLREKGNCLRKEQLAQKTRALLGPVEGCVPTRLQPRFRRPAAWRSRLRGVTSGGVGERN